MSKKIKSLLTRIASIFTNGAPEATQASPAEHKAEKNVFGGDSPLPALSYVNMVMFLDRHYQTCDHEQGHISYTEMRKQLSTMEYQDIKMLFDAVIEIRALSKPYIDVEVEEVIENKE